MSKTEENLKVAFAGEAQARNKYTYFAKVAEKEGLHYISKIFLETAENELQHAKEEFKLLKGISDTKTNLKHAIEGEHYECSKMYADFALDAKKEGNNEAEKLFLKIAEIEKHHEERFKVLLNMLEHKTLFRREEAINWKCAKCGYIHNGKEPPLKCPCCNHPREFYEPENMSLR